MIEEGSRRAGLWGRGVARQNLHRQAELGAARDAHDLADQPAHRGLKAVGARGELRRQGHIGEIEDLIVIAVRDDALHIIAMGHRELEVRVGRSFGQGPPDLGGQADIPRAVPIGVPALVLAEVHAQAEAVARPQAVLIHHQPRPHRMLPIFHAGGPDVGAGRQGGQEALVRGRCERPRVNDATCLGGRSGGARAHPLAVPAEGPIAGAALGLGRGHIHANLDVFGVGHIAEAALAALVAHAEPEHLGASRCGRLHRNVDDDVKVEDLPGLGRVGRVRLEQPRRQAGSTGLQAGGIGDLHLNHVGVDVVARRHDQAHLHGAFCAGGQAGGAALHPEGVGGRGPGDAANGVAQGQHGGKSKARSQQGEREQDGGRPRHRSTWAAGRDANRVPW